MRPQLSGHGCDGCVHSPCLAPLAVRCAEKRAHVTPSTTTMMHSMLVVAFLVALVRAFDALVVYDPTVHDLGADPAQLDPLLSQFFHDAFQLFEVKAYTDETLDLFVAGQVKYLHVVLLPSSRKTMAKKNLNQRTLVEFVEAEGNVLVVGGNALVIPDDVRLFLNELGIFPSPKGFQLHDYFNEEAALVLLSAANFVTPQVLPFVNATGETVLYAGGAALLSNNPLLLPLVQASETSFTSDDTAALTEDGTWTFGTQGYAACGFQALNNARVAWVGAPSLLGPELIEWVFQQRGVLKLQYVQHHKAEEPEHLNNSTLYRIKDQIIYTVGVSEFKQGEWVPYEAQGDANQLQLAFKMLDPYQRLNLQPLGPTQSRVDGPVDTTAYFVNFTAPDHHGMFTFELDYQRAGLSYLLDKRIVTVRHLANDEYKRSWLIPNAWVYIASAGFVVVMWLVFVINFLYIGNVDYSKKNV